MNNVTEIKAYLYNLKLLGYKIYKQKGVSLSKTEISAIKRYNGEVFIFEMDSINFKYDRIYFKISFRKLGVNWKGKNHNLTFRGFNVLNDLVDALRSLKCFIELPKRVNKFDIDLFKKNIEEDLNLNVWLAKESDNLYIINEMTDIEHLKDTIDYLKDYAKTLLKMNVENIPKYLLYLIEE